MIDLRQYWRDNPELAAKPKKMGSWYGIEWPHLPAGALQQQANFQGDQNSTFVLCSIAGVQISDAGTAYVTQPMQTSFLNKANSADVTSIKLDWSILMATLVTLSSPYYLPYPITIPPTGQFNAYIDNPGADPINVQMSFGGIRVYT